MLCNIFGRRDSKEHRVTSKAESWEHIYPRLRKLCVMLSPGGATRNMLTHIFISEFREQ